MKLNRFKNLDNGTKLFCFSYNSLIIAPIFMIDMRSYGFVLCEELNKIVKKNIHKYNANIFYGKEEIEKEYKKRLK